MYRVAIDRDMAIVVISVKCMALFVLIACSLVAVSDGCTSDAGCDQFFDEVCCNNECVQGTRDCCSSNLDCFAGESCHNHKCLDDGDDGDPGNTLVIVFGVLGESFSSAG